MLITIAAMTLALGPGSGASCVQDEVSTDPKQSGADYGWVEPEGEARTPSEARTLVVRSAKGWETVDVRVPVRSVLLPIISRSEVVVRPDVGPDGIEIATVTPRGGTPATLLVQACVHPSDHQLAQVDGVFVLLGPPELPRTRILEFETGERRSDAVPRLARRDGIHASVDLLELCLDDPQDPGLSLVAIAPGGRGGATRTPGLEFSEWVALGGPLAEHVHGERDPRTGLGMRTNLGSTSASEIWVWAVDQLFLTPTRSPLPPILVEGIRPPPSEPPSELVAHVQGAVDLADAEFHRLRFDAIEAAAGTTVTYVVTFVDAADSMALLRRADPSGFFLDAAVESIEPLRNRVAFDGDSLARAVHLEGPDEQLDIRPTMGPGAAWGDVDLDGWNDIYVVQGGGREGSPIPTNRLFENDASMLARDTRSFTDVTDTWGGADTGAGMGALFLDADGDRDLDLFVANYGADVLFENRLEESTDGTPKLVDVSATAGVGGDLWSAGICAGDVDNDGDLDLYVTSYLEYDESQMPSLEDLPYQREDPVAMLPFAFPGQRNQLLINESTPDGLRFVDRAKEWRAADELGRGMQPIMFDFDRDGWLDLYVANDVSPNVLFKNNKDGRFRDVSFATGMDDPRGGMGVALGDVDMDGDEDLFLTNWELEPNALYTSNLQAHASQRHRVATFRDTIVKSGLGPHGVGVTSWAAVLFDLENDGDLDLFVANGYTSPDYESTGICVGQPDHLFTNDGRGKFTVAHEKIAPFAENGGRDLPSRCAIECDFDRDGDVDLFVTANNSAYRLLENHTREPGAPNAEGAGHWLGVKLLAPAPNTYAIGARVEVVTDRRTFVRTLLAGSGYLGGNAPELHFGLGTAERIERVVVHPPGYDAATDGPVAPRVFTPEDTTELALDRWVTLDLR
ncbi:FG-GAP repeat protein [Planctomycetes bacterium Pla163]|uniref:FG-GAP repeat protein n=1 Tax=Rohdeia mirabilis TaxID=2528008 RepID=A0A518D203_9BACT|nr:FG-GAP repeat protein [Planctomycetes bacterium Pla163]